jgi:hypothetical protein
MNSVVLFNQKNKYVERDRIQVAILGKNSFYGVEEVRDDHVNSIHSITC